MRAALVAWRDVYCGDPYDVEATRRFAACCAARGDSVAAADILRQGVTLAPAATALWHDLAATLARAGRHAEAQQAAAHAATLPT
ncbi:MAG: hypothetical protein JSR18_14385 [Proteobacteria bacterium]|nr:hypothetical protein [Pseudomonadota bacterium]